VQHGPERRLVGGDDGLAEFSLPVRHERHRGEVATGDDQRLYLWAVGSSGRPPPHPP
jgi:hypothetical protein